MGKLFEALTKAGPARKPDRKPDLPDRALARPLGMKRQAVPAAEKRGNPTHDEADLYNPAVRIGDFDPKLVALNETFSPVAENFRRLRAKIVHPASGKAPRSILVTSVMQNEGKGFVAANLGITMAQGVEQHALLVDCDLRLPTLAGLFGLGNDPGLADYLQGEAALPGLVKKTGIAKLSIIPSGRPPVNPAELLSSEKMAGFMDDLRSRYADRFVIFDSPPMQAASETAVLAKQVEGVVLVVRWGMAAREQVKKLAHAIGSNKIIGIIFNGVQVNELENRLYRYRGYSEYGSYRYGNE